MHLARCSLAVLKDCIRQFVCRSKWRIALSFLMNACYERNWLRLGACEISTSKLPSFVMSGLLLSWNGSRFVALRFKSIPWSTEGSLSQGCFVQRGHSPWILAATCSVQELPAHAACPAFLPSRFSRAPFEDLLCAYLPLDALCFKRCVYSAR